VVELDQMMSAEQLRRDRVRLPIPTARHHVRSDGISRRCDQ
jgi:hypothetical protein